MSKPKPGLGKGIARTLSHSVPSATSAVIHHPVPLPSALSSPARATSVYYQSPLPRSQWPSLYANPQHTTLPIWVTPTAAESSRRPYVTATAPYRAAVETSTSTFSFSQHPPSPPVDWPLLSSFVEYSLPPPPPPLLPTSTGPSRAPSPPHPTQQSLIPDLRATVISPVPQLNNNSNPAPATSHVTTFGVNSESVNPHPSSSVPDPNNLNLYSSSLIFHLGASGLAKERLPTPPRRAGGSAPPPPRPRSFPLPEITPPTDLQSTGVGEDSYFARVDGVCVADGVGGWSRSGKGPADPGRWARLLTHYCEEEVERWWAGAEDYLATDDDVSGWAARAWKLGSEDRKPHRPHRRPLDPVEIMQKGYEKCLSCASKENIYGSSTCLLALLHHSTLLVANLGDCSLLVVRRGEVVFRTSEMQHAFNFPLQLGTHSRDEPMKDAKRYDIGVEKEDVVIVGSDGLMDNLFDEDILETLAEFASPSQEPSSLPPFLPQVVSEALLDRARQVSEQTTATTPFMVRAIEEGIDFVGGKKDDISVVVGVVGESGHQSLTLDTSSQR